ncbi:MAG: ribonuclease HII, partial [Elusimicrobiota bacterium]|nr:ribonuclease HII [Elusimicrobiota bacterium]
MPLTLFDQNTQLRHPNRLLVGVDEAGRGPLAGPVTACACHIPPALYGHPVMAQINDSKKITPAKRKKIAAELKMLPITYCLGFASSAEIDAVNILQATFLAMRRALKKFEAKPVFALIDGNKTVPAINCPQQAVIGGDASSLAVAAASILAKVARDDFMD